MSESLFNLGANVTFTGLAIVFLMLILLVLIISCFSLFSKVKKLENNGGEKTSKPIKSQPVVMGAPVATDDEDEIIAVIAAAVASMYEGTGVKPVIKSVKAARSTQNIWALSGLIENTRAF